MKSLTSTNAVIQLQGDDNAEKIDVSRQRLSRCGSEISNATPWVGHTGKMRKPRGPTRSQITYTMAQISFQNTKSVFKNTNQRE